MDIHLIALCAAPEIGPVSIRRLIKAFGSPEAVLKAPAKELSSVEGIGEKRAGGIRKLKGLETLDALRRKIEKIEGQGARVVTYGSPGYPEALREADAPLVFYMKGEMTKQDRYALAVVGSRKPTAYGLAVTGSLSSELAAMGFTIVSGLARGIDTAAHAGALKAGGRSIAVLGSGIDVPYPPENKALMERIAQSGCVITEFAPGTPPNRENFPRRNRIISGLSLGVLVAEAGAKSGALITAAYALEQGKEVFAIPGNISSAASSGANDLIKQGAKVVVRAQDVTEELAPQLKGFIKSKEKAEVEVSGEEKALCALMSPEPKHIDNITRESGLPPQKALALLLQLELKGVVRQAEGMRFHLT